MLKLFDKYPIIPTDGSKDFTISKVPLAFSAIEKTIQNESSVEITVIDAYGCAKIIAPGESRKVLMRTTNHATKEKTDGEEA